MEKYENRNDKEELINLDSSRCNIQKVNYSDMTSDLFFKEYVNKPFILVGDKRIEDNKLFQTNSSIEELIKVYGDDEMILSSANVISHDKIKVTLKQYVQDFMKPFTLQSNANETWYLFGDNDVHALKYFFKSYKLPKIIQEVLDTGKLKVTSPSYSFGLAAHGSGVPFHVHGPVFAEVNYGAKRWFLYDPTFTDIPDFDVSMTSLYWVVEKYPKIMEKGGIYKDQLYECTCQPGETLFIPDAWYHSTINIGDSVFISSFV